MQIPDTDPLAAAVRQAITTGDLPALESLDLGADLEADGGVIGGGTPIADAVAFGQWQAARRLVERGARTSLWQSAALGLMDRVTAAFESSESPPPDEITKAFWCACYGGQLRAAEYLLQRGAALNWIGYDHLTPLEAAQRSNAEDVVQWLRSIGAKAARH